MFGLLILTVVGICVAGYIGDRIELAFVKNRCGYCLGWSADPNGRLCPQCDGSGLSTFVLLRT